MEGFIFSDTVEELRYKALESIDKFIKSQGSLFYLSNDGKGLDFKSPITRNIGTESLKEHGEYYHKIDPLVKATLISSIITKPVVTQQVVSWKNLFKTRYYREFLNRFSYYQHMVIPLTSKKGLLGHVVLLSPSDSLFSLKELRKACALQPVLELALEKTILLEKHTRLDCLMKFLVEEQGQRGIILLDGSLKPVYENEKARTLFKILYDGQYKGPHLPEPFMDELNSQILSKSTSKFSLKTDSSSTNTVCSITYRKEEDYCLLLFESTKTLMEAVRKIGISQRECEVISLLCEGLKNAEIGKKLFISEATVENHLNNIYEKMGIRNRTSLARKIHCLLNE